MLSTDLRYKTLSGYKMLLRENARALWSGEWEFYGFYDGMMTTIRRGFTQAWTEGMAKFNLTLADQSPEERAQLEVEINAETAYIEGVADFIDANSRANGGLLSTCQQRMEIWVAGYNRVVQLAMAMAGQDQPLEWQYGPTEHCENCENLNGRVYRSSIWYSHNILPRSWDLACHGIHCQCELVPTTKPLTRGRPPTL